MHCLDLVSLRSPRQMPLNTVAHGTSCRVHHKPMFRATPAPCNLRQSLLFEPHCYSVSKSGVQRSMLALFAFLIFSLSCSVSFRSGYIMVCEPNRARRSVSLAMAPHSVHVKAIGPSSILTDGLAAVASDCISESCTQEYVVGDGSARRARQCNRSRQHHDGRLGGSGLRCLGHATHPRAHPHDAHWRPPGSWPGLML